MRKSKLYKVVMIMSTQKGYLEKYNSCSLAALFPSPCITPGRHLPSLKLGTFGEGGYLIATPKPVCLAVCFSHHPLHLFSHSQLRN